ncbi:MAG: 2-C-methyl-D-erythritol 4-phosphate cytidylyltransferase [Planctomycetes bacterium]|nr:2-C-methyl-D-erythritol 4-phosphate cytidylyltransferase [Planctomycetota bacterium]MCB9869809.1 2-C-methyl-D-erythritol 4-phosphate cytidylyltransferase [Planctomycetota bacterium]
MPTACLLLAAGRGTRMGDGPPKVFRPLHGVPVLVRTARRLHELGISQTVLAIHPDDRATHLAPLQDALSGAGVGPVIDGGATRQESMERALAHVSAATDVVLIHDAARPFFPLEAARRAIEEARVHGAAILALPLADTLKRVAADRRVMHTVDRAGLWLAQTPQAVRRDVLLRALAASDGSHTDDSALVEQLGLAVVVVPGSPRNLKLTTPDDLDLAGCIAELEDRGEHPGSRT